MVTLVHVRNKNEGQVRAHDLLKKLIDPTTLLALSGGTSMDYRRMIVDPIRRNSGQANDIIPGAICVVDERYGEPFHEDSNEKLLADAGIKKFADKHCIPTIKYLVGKDFEETANIYDNKIKDLFLRFPKRVGVMGVGTNLHTAGIFPGSKALKSQDYVVAEEVDDRFPKRITLTIKALGEFTNFVVMMFGQEKKEALEIILNEAENDAEKYPAVFYRKSGIKTFLVTDILN